MQIAGGAFPEMVGAPRHRQVEGLDGTPSLGLYLWELQTMNKQKLWTWLVRLLGYNNI